MENGASCLSKSDRVRGIQLSTNAEEYGAVSVFYPGVLQRLAQLMASDLYIVFTSRNEGVIYSVSGLYRSLTPAGKVKVCTLRLIR